MSTDFFHCRLREESSAGGALVIVLIVESVATHLPSQGIKRVNPHAIDEEKMYETAR
jgi:hypothetical protein